MNQTSSSRRHAVLRPPEVVNLTKQAIRITMLLAVGLWLSACNHDKDDEANPTQTASDVKLTRKIDSLFVASMQDGTVPGMSVVVIKQGKTFFQKNYGYADLQAKTPVTNDTRFAIGSTTKAMTAFAVLTLVDKGILKLNEKVTTYLPDFVMKDARYKDIQVKHLLTHSAGLRGFTQLATPDDSPKALEGILPLLANEDLEFTPGQGFYYSNYGMTLAGLLVQRVTKMSYEAYMDQYLFDKVGMPNTTMEYWQPNALGGTKGYVLDAQNQLVETPPYFNRLYNPAGAGTITTSTDVGRYLTMLVSGVTTSGGEKLLSDSLATRMFTGSVNADSDDYAQYIKAQGATYGFGWYNVNRNGYVTIEHGGNILSMLSHFFIDPKTKSAVGIMINQQDFSKPEVAAQAAHLVFSAD